jgi:hypothetical protein
VKKYLPFILLGVGLVAIVLVYFFVTRSKETLDPSSEDEVVSEVPFEKRPVLSLTPTADGHYLVLFIEKINIEAKTLDYELLYDVPNGVTQGVPGSIDISGKSSFQAELLMGSESSGKFRYDEGVSNGTVTLRFRNEKGKLVAKFTSDFHMQRSTDELTSVDSAFTLKLDSTPKNIFTIVMNTVGTHGKVPSGKIVGPYGVFSSDGSAKLSGNVSINDASKVYVEDGNFSEITSLSSRNTPLIFVGQ